MALTIDEAMDFVDDVADVVSNPRLRSELQEWTEDTKQELSDMMHGQKSPDGTPYAPLSPVTVKRKGHAKALFETGALHESVKGAGSGHIERVTHHEVTLGTNHEKKGRPVASILHYGAGRIPGRPFVGVTHKMADNAAKLVADGLINQADKL